MLLHRKVFFGVLAALVITELAVRVSGLIDFPVYSVDNEIGYIPEPNQTGTFLHRNSWMFNDKSMGTAKPWNPNAQPNVLLIGNSVVMGGNPYDQKDKLGPLLQADIGSGFTVWPIAAGGWTNVNETVYLDRNPDVASSSGFFIWEYMYGGLSYLSEWPGEYAFPKSKPLWASWYVLRHYLLFYFLPPATEAPLISSPNLTNLTSFKAAVAKLRHSSALKGGGLIFLYPTRAHYLQAAKGEEWLPERAELFQIAAENGLQIIDIASAPEWNETLYRKDGMHPSVQGNAVLAAILARAMLTSQSAAN
jgi:hypothetical protein